MIDFKYCLDREHNALCKIIQEDKEIFLSENDLNNLITKIFNLRSDAFSDILVSVSNDDLIKDLQEKLEYAESTITDLEDDCDYYDVSKEQIKELLEICITIKNKSKMQKGFVKNGETYKNGMWCPCYEEGEYIINPEIASELLPTQDGFFFGGTAYDQWYMENIKSTIDILTKTLEETDFDREMVVYNSSW